ncbi:hypothetical protein RI054_22g97000 [Pseudoscourfieldia marina]
MTPAVATGTNRPLGSQGSSASWTASKRTIKNIFHMFIEAVPEARQITRGHTDLDHLPEDVVCSRELYARFAGFLVEQYKIKDGQRLKVNTARNYLNYAIQAGSDRFKANGAPATRLFFTCTDIGSNAEPAVWLQGLRRQMHRALFGHAVEEGACLDQSAAPVYLEHIKRISRALVMEGSQEALARRFTLMNLWISAGRASEVQWSTYDTTLKWDAEFENAGQAWAQMKTGREKLVVWVPGVDRHCCIYAAHGDYLATTRPMYNSDRTDNWMLPELHRAGAVRAVLTSYLRCAARGVATKKYEAVACDVPQTTTAGGIRPGACNMLASSVPAEFATTTTGHELSGSSAFYEYLDCTHARCVPGAMVLAGWEPPPWGTLTKGPSAPSLRAITTIHGISSETMDAFVDRLFSFDSASPPTLRVGNAFREGVRASVRR